MSDSRVRNMIVPVDPSDADFYARLDFSQPQEPPHWCWYVGMVVTIWVLLYLFFSGSYAPVRCV